MKALQVLDTRPMDVDTLNRDIPLIVLSARTVSNFYDTHIVTDSLGESVLKKFNLPVTIHNVLDMQEYHTKLWCASKFEAYKYFENEDFVCIDNDVILERALDTSKDVLCDCNESSIYPVLTNTVNTKILHNLHRLDIHSLDSLNESYTVGVFYMRNKFRRSLFTSAGSELLKLISDRLSKSPEYISDHDGGIYMFAAEARLLPYYVKDLNVEFVRNDSYFNNVGKSTSADIEFKRKLEELLGNNALLDITKDGNNLTTVNSTGYTHFMSYMRKDPNYHVQNQVAFYLATYYPEIADILVDYA